MAPPRWVAASGAHIELIHVTGTSNIVSPNLRDGGTRDGWWLIVKHPDTYVVLSATWLPKLGYPDTRQAGVLELATALGEIGAVLVTERGKDGMIARYVAPDQERVERYAAEHPPVEEE